MMGVDTNVLVRYLVKDDPVQASHAVSIFHEAASRDEKLFLNHVVLCETIWVLRRSYGYSRDHLMLLIEMLLITRQIEIEGKDLVRRALKTYRRSLADFADCLIGAKNKEAGCRSTVSFDAGALTLDTFSAPEQ